MSIGTALEIKRQREAIAQLQRDFETMKKMLEASTQTHLTTDQRLNELEAKRGPGRPRTTSESAR